MSVGMYAQTVVGTWNYYYDWECNGSYNSTTITFNNDGTFSTGFGNNGKWYQVQNYVIWEFPSGTTYAGNMVGNAMLGMMATTWSSKKGCWYCTKKTLRLKRKPEVQIDASGKKIIMKKK